MRSLKFTALALDDLRLEWPEWQNDKRLKHWSEIAPPIPSDPVGYERQLLWSLQVGLMALDQVKSGLERELEELSGALRRTP